MPHFAIICRDKPGHLDLRQSTREAHLAYLRGTESLLFAGPLLDQGAATGSLIVIEADGITQAKAWAAADPYAQAGLFASVEVVEWKKVFG